MDLTFFLDREHATPLYQQLYTALKDHMHEGRLERQARLPSKRMLAAHLSVSQTTVERAYDQLEAEGYIVSKPRSGRFVDYDASNELQMSVDAVTSRTVAPSSNEAMIDFHYGSTDTVAFPHTVWRRSLLHSLDQYGQRLYQTGQPTGEPELRELIADYVYQARQIRCSPEQIIIAAGTPILLQWMGHLFGATTSIGYEHPGSARSRDIFANNHWSLLPIPLDREGITIHPLQQQCPQLVYVTPSHQFPLGTVMTINRRIQLLQWAVDTGAYIIEDDYDSEFRYSGKPIPALKGLDRHDRVVYTGTFSKSVLPSLRISYMILPESLLTQGKQIASLYKQTVASHLQLALADFMQNGSFQKHINRMRKWYGKKRLVLLEAIQSQWGDRVTIRSTDSGLHVLLDIHSDFTEQQLIDRAALYGVVVYPASVFYEYDSPSHTIMLGFSGMSDEDIRRGVHLLGEAWNL
ncbi:PLP-dependent aminotransferase family protein [Paenibacillus kandeliae]|uniref:MocR-like pyridoxine biosynthesis transcription factor PdxR n=1 Tax=Paenibacillus kandeliae TaxID=3231269 RepID=UPI0034578489